MKFRKERMRILYETAVAAGALVAIFLLAALFGLVRPRGAGQ